MNRMLFLLLTWTIPISLFSQTRFHLGTVKGEHVTHRCALHTSKSSSVKLVNGQFIMGPEKTSGHPNIWDVWNAHNPDTIAKFANYGNSYDFMELLSGTEIHNPGKIMEDEKRWQEWRKEMKEDSEQK